MGKIITFYSYKGGVGRTMCLANISILLAQWGYKVLVVDWDLEAPGLENFYKGYIDIDVKEKNGLINILTDLKDDSNVTVEDAWKSCLNTVSINEDSKNIYLITAGKRDEDYYNKVRSFDVNNFYRKEGGGELIENLRNSWKDQYDFVLIDSRTGITDIGGICTIQLPDILVLLFTATNQGFKGIRDVAERAIKAREELPFERLHLLTLPIPTRIDNSEKKQTDEWILKFKEGLENIYSGWLTGSIDKQNFLRLTKVPYIAYHSYGEKLPVVEQNSTIDTTGIAYAYQSIAALIATELNYSQLLLDNRDKLLKLADANYLKQMLTGFVALISQELQSISLRDKVKLSVKQLLDNEIGLNDGKDFSEQVKKLSKAIIETTNTISVVDSDIFSSLKKEIPERIFTQLEPIDSYFIEASKEHLLDNLTSQLSFLSKEIENEIISAVFTKNESNLILSKDEQELVDKEIGWIASDLVKEIISRTKYLLEKRIETERRGNKNTLDNEGDLDYLNKKTQSERSIGFRDSLNDKILRSTAFIIRPFGIKQDVDFDKVDKNLLQPALERAGIRGSTTATIVEQGNIREDMFAQLLLADIVIADVSIHNANVFYELGIRHALRDKRTFLIRCSKDEVPFDLKTDRYLSYPADNPEMALEALVLALQATLLSDNQDSPVFYMLPRLEAQNPEKFLAVPPDFTEEVEIARVSKQYGKLSLLAEEVKGFQWQVPAYRIIGDVQFSCKKYEDAKVTWEKVSKKSSEDFDANDRLATIYQRMAEEILTSDPSVGLELLTQSDIAIKRLLSKYLNIDRSKRAEVYSLKGRNSKAKWINSWKNSEEENRNANALQSRYLYEGYNDYEKAYYEDLNHFYSGINALGLLTIITSLARQMPEVWELEYESVEEAKDALKNYNDQHQKLATIVAASLDAERKRLKGQGVSDPWVAMTEADLACLISNRPQRVASLYYKVLQEASGFNFDAAQRQLLIYEQLNIITDNVKAALTAFANTEISSAETKKCHYILFTGHMLDKPGRKEPRFPASKEAVVRAAIKAVVQKEKENADGPVTGICGGACGADILFHEVCKELDIPTELYLALPRDQFIVESVQFAGADWVDRFDDLYKVLPKKILSQTKELPVWLQKKGNYSIWERNNLWMLYETLSHGSMQMTLIAFWDGKTGDGAGGTSHMVSEAKERGAKTIVLKANEII